MFNISSLDVKYISVYIKYVNDEKNKVFFKSAKKTDISRVSISWERELYKVLIVNSLEPCFNFTCAIQMGLLEGVTVY